MGDKTEKAKGQDAVGGQSAVEPGVIKPCPFDGGAAFYWLDTRYQDKHVIECEECGIQKRHEYSKEGAIRLWNERAL